ncbi:MAG: hypothetical protein J5933_03475 [Clostridia bacterium]|nr:hypothetical protein [Clostridia bacterium]
MFWIVSIMVDSVLWVLFLGDPTWKYSQLVAVAAVTGLIIILAVLYGKVLSGYLSRTEGTDDPVEKQKREIAAARSNLIWLKDIADYLDGGKKQ